MTRLAQPLLFRFSLCVSVTGKGDGTEIVFMCRPALLRIYPRKQTVNRFSRSFCQGVEQSTQVCYKHINIALVLDCLTTWDNNAKGAKVPQWLGFSGCKHNSSVLIYVPFWSAGSFLFIDMRRILKTCFAVDRGHVDCDMRGCCTYTRIKLNYEEKKLLGINHFCFTFFKCIPVPNPLLSCAKVFSLKLLEMLRVVGVNSNVLLWDFMWRRRSMMVKIFYLIRRF